MYILIELLKMANILEKHNVTSGVDSLMSENKNISAKDNSIYDTKIKKENVIQNITTNVPFTNCSTQKRLQRRGIKEKPEHPDRVLFCLGVKNPIRTLCINIVDSKYVIYVSVIFLKLL